MHIAVDQGRYLGARAGIEELAAVARSGQLDLGQTGIASIMFTDIVDSTALAAAVGDIAWSRIIKHHLDQMARLVTDHGGRMVKSLGDGTLCSFPSASAALTAARRIQQRMEAAESEPRLRLRIGIHTGDIVEAQGDYLGTVVNKAARITAVARPGEIRVSDATRAMVGSASGLEFSARETVSLKGFEGEHGLYLLDWRA